MICPFVRMEIEIVVVVFVMEFQDFKSSTLNFEVWSSNSGTWSAKASKKDQTCDSEIKTAKKCVFATLH